MACRTRFDHLPLHPQRRRAVGRFIAIPANLPQLGGTVFKVYCVLVRHAQRETQRAWPHETTIAREVGCSVRTVQYSIAKLRCMGLIHVQKMHGRGNVYTLMNCGSEPQPIAAGIYSEQERVKNTPPAPPRGDRRPFRQRRVRRISPASAASFTPSPAEVAKREAERQLEIEQGLKAKAAALLESPIGPRACREAAECVSGLLGTSDLRGLEDALTGAEDKLAAEVEAAAPESVVIDLRERARQQLLPYRDRMSPTSFFQAKMQSFRKLLFAHYGLPRLSSFYSVTSTM